MSNDLELDALQRRLRQFAADRDWGRFHTPKNLAMALAGEVGELIAEMQWLSEAESAALIQTGSSRQTLVDEIADVAIYLLRLCDVLGIDLLGAARKRIDENELRFPPETVRGQAIRSRDLKAED